ncbi:unnamed protein product [Rotaria socialis]|uniref:DNA-directed RNA polymerase n=3 Tax=Rotaria socialis TaxID=392032 RepID=A0A818R6Z8_9BILA|nr:unnamed protein product [Rotaria socialis]CAF3711987.1 unnamed protein product [Rotaria socialis]CAF4571400.1 unnamed protein product [Rotaria socialis]CAF4719026.1 unnamed protein product [Rotaria socialis]
MLRIIHFRPFLLNTCIRTPRQLAVLCRPLSVETLSAHRDIDDCNHRVEIAAPHHELLEVLHYRSSQLQSFTKTIRSPRKMSPSSDRSTAKTSTRPRSNANRKTLIKSNIESKPVKEEKPIDLARPKASKSKEKKKKEKKPTPSPVPTPTNRINELSKKLKLTKSTGKHQSKTLTNNNNNNNNISDEILAAENEHEGPQSEEPLILPVIDEATANDEDKTLNELLTSLNSTKVRRLHKYTDLQIKFMHTHNEFNRMLQAYVDVLVSHGKLNQARRVLDEILSEQERRRSSKILAWRYVTNVHVFNSLYFGYAEKGNLPALQKLFETMRKFNIKPTLESYAAAISCLGSMELLDSSVARRIILDLEKEGFRVLDIFNLDCLNHEHIQSILKVLKTFRPDFDIPLRSSNVNSKILNSIYEKSAISKDELIQTDQWWKDTDLKKKLDEQIQMEKAHRVKIKSINAIKLPDEKLAKRYENFLVDLEQQLTVGFLTELEILKQKVRKTSDINIIPFLEIFEPKEYIDLMLKTLHQHSYASEFHSSPFVTLCVTLGKHLYQKYVCKMRQKNGFIDKLHLIYDDYTNHVVTNQRFIVNERQKWNEITKEKFAFMDRNDRRWTFTQVLQVGEFLYDVMLKHAKIRVPLLTNQYTASNKSDNSIMHIVYRNLGACSEKQVKIHPTVLHFFSHIPEATLDFSCTELPCLVPPLPWLSSTMGGYLLTQTEFVRSPFGATQQDTRLRTLPTEKIGGLFDSINILNSCPWKINGQVLDLLMDIFRRGGDRRLSVPVSIENANLTEPLPIEKGLSTDELKRREIALAKMRKLKAEIFSLWCYELYRLSIANHFRNEIFWFPHNLDFRGRVYPIPPHFNHLGSDIARSIILFAEGKPLGPNGLRQLKIHLVNLTDLKKKASINDRAKYADEIMDDILDSADRPLEGRQWWKQSEEPWQTLACCMEIACAIRSPDHTKYVSHFPVHQDGSCNVLQHYAAMGLDDIGAASVNLKPNDLPQDVYSVVVDQVEQERKQDAANGLPIAKILEGFIKRKVIKQTIMTTNYGVTLFGARQQISRQLRDIDEFPREHISEASSYLAQKTFISLRELFRETRKIQDWFTDCARLISRVREAAVEWNTPLNLPVVQPYYQEVRMRHKGKDIYDYYSSFARPNSTKQKNAFPPNYVHSLDSTHMMMTALQCARNGITFVSVHDSFWTHACDADRLSKYCREQFVALHKEPLLEILSQELVSKYEFKSSEYARADEKQKQTMKLLNETLRRVPERGTFKLESVLDSTYFFS